MKMVGLTGEGISPSVSGMHPLPPPWSTWRVVGAGIDELEAWSQGLHSLPPRG
jgi:hypothetical protein